MDGGRSTRTSPKPVQSSTMSGGGRGVRPKPEQSVCTPVKGHSDRPGPKLAQSGGLSKVNHTDRSNSKSAQSTVVSGIGHTDRPDSKSAQPTVSGVGHTNRPDSKSAQSTVVTGIGHTDRPHSRPAQSSGKTRTSHLTRTGFKPAQSGDIAGESQNDNLPCSKPAESTRTPAVTAGCEGRGSRVHDQGAASSVAVSKKKRPGSSFSGRTKSGNDSNSQNTGSAALSSKAVHQKAFHLPTAAPSSPRTAAADTSRRQCATKTVHATSTSSERIRRSSKSSSVNPPTKGLSIKKTPPSLVKEPKTRIVSRDKNVSERTSNAPEKSPYGSMRGLPARTCKEETQNENKARLSLKKECSRLKHNDSNAEENAAQFSVLDQNERTEKEISTREDVASQDSISHANQTRKKLVSNHISLSSCNEVTEVRKQSQLHAPKDQRKPKPAKDSSEAKLISEPKTAENTSEAKLTKETKEAKTRNESTLTKRDSELTRAETHTEPTVFEEDSSFTMGEIKIELNLHAERSKPAINKVQSKPILAKESEETVLVSEDKEVTHTKERIEACTEHQESTAIQEHNKLVVTSQRSSSISPLLYTHSNHSPSLDEISPKSLTHLRELWTPSSTNTVVLPRRSSESVMVDAADRGAADRDEVSQEERAGKEAEGEEDMDEEEEEMMRMRFFKDRRPSAVYFTSDKAEGFPWLTWSSLIHRNQEELHPSPQQMLEAARDPNYILSLVLELGDIIGQGQYGTVYEAALRSDRSRKTGGKESGEVLALKKLNKAGEESTVHALAEQRALVMGRECPFIVTMFSCFQTKFAFYLLLELAEGGSLTDVLKQAGRLPENNVRFYAAQLLVALSFLHDKDILHRDLKVDNVLLDATGYIRLCDFGLSMDEFRDDDQVCSPCGTLFYIAPEVLRGESYGKTADWWSYGVLLHNMATGVLPFGGRNIQELYIAVTRREPVYPSFLSPDLISLTRKMLTKTPINRPGHSADQRQALKDEPFFAAIDWEALYDRSFVPPELPKHCLLPTKRSNSLRVDSDAILSASFPLELQDMIPAERDRQSKQTRSRSLDPATSLFVSALFPNTKI